MVATLVLEQARIGFGADVAIAVVAVVVVVLELCSRCSIVVCLGLG